MAARGALDEPGRGGQHADRRDLLALAELPRCAVAPLRRIELGGDAEVALATRREADVAADAREPERADRLAVVVASHEVPLTLAQEQAVGVHRARRLLVGRDRPVREDDRALLGDGRLDLLQALGHLGGEPVAEQPQAHAGGGVLARVRPAEREVLQGEPQWLGVRELALEQVDARRESCELGIGQVQRGQEVLLALQRVQLLAGELVALRADRDAQGRELGAVRVEASRERLVGHVVVALDVLLDVARRRGAALGHQIRNQRQLAYELVGVGSHGRPAYRPGGAGDDPGNLPKCARSPGSFS